MGNSLRCLKYRSRKYVPAHPYNHTPPSIVVKFAPLVMPEEEGSDMDEPMDLPSASSFFGLVDTDVVMKDEDELVLVPPIKPANHRKFTTVSIQTISYALPEGYAPRLEYLGGGAYGNVVKTEVICRDGMRRIVAIKKLKDPFGVVLQARRIYREIKLLQLMQHDNIIRAIDLYTPNTSVNAFKDVYVVTEYAGHSLHKLLRSQRLSNEHIVFIVYQILRALKYIHSAKIMHRDLKPGNLALTPDCDLTVLDFGLARSMQNDNTSLTQYVMTRWYRSPEVIYWDIDSYNTQADIWSVGCIAAELMTGQPLFPGDDANVQYTKVTDLCGSPDKILLDKIGSNHSESMRQVIESYGVTPRVDFRERFKGCSEDFIDFLDRVLVLDPERRMTVEQALAHPYLKVHHTPDDEPNADQPFTLDEDPQRTIQEWKTIIWNEIQNFRGDQHSPHFVYQQ